MIVNTITNLHKMFVITSTTTTQDVCDYEYNNYFKMFVNTSTTTTSRCLGIRVQQLPQDVCEYEYNNYPKMFVNTSTVLLRQMQLLK